MQKQKYNWISKIIALFTVSCITVISTGQASAKILFQDDQFRDVDSEGIMINADDGGDEDVTLQLGNDGTDATITFDDGTGNLNVDTAGGTVGFNNNDLTGTGGLDFSGVIDFSGASELHVREVADEATSACTTINEIVLDTTEHRFYVCTVTGSPGTWISADSGSLQDLENVYTQDSDNTLTTGNLSFTVDTGTSDFLVNSNDWDVDANGNINVAAGADYHINNVGLTDTGAGVSGAGLIGFDNSVSSNLSSTTTQGAIDEIVSDFGSTTAGNGAGLVGFDNTNSANLSSTNTQAAVDEIVSDLGNTTNGNGASLIGIEDASNWYTGGDLESALNEVEALLGSSSSTVYNFSENNALNDNDTVYTSLNKLDLKWGDLANTANGEGASLVGIEDSGSNFTATTVEGALTELATNAPADGSASGDTLYWNGSAWVSSNLINNDNTDVALGNNGGNVSIDSSTWDISSTGVASGFTGLASTGVVNFSGASRFAMVSGAANPGTCTEGDLFYNTTDNLTYACTALNTWTTIGSGADAGTLDSLDSSQFVRSDASDTWGDSAGIQTLTFGDGTNADSLTFAANSSLDLTNATITGLDASEVSYDGTNVDSALGTRTFGENNVLTDDASFTANLNSLDLKWGDLGSTANGEGSSLVGVEDTGAYYTGTDLESVLQEIGGQIGSNSPQVDTMVFEAEYPDAVTYQDGSNNKGKLEALYDNTNRKQYYRWTTRQNSLQDIDIRFRYTLPADYNSAGNLLLDLRNDTIATGDNAIAVTVRNDTDNATCHADGNVTASSANTWETLTITNTEIETGCTGASALDPGDVVEIQIKALSNNTNGGGTDVGTLSFNYNN